MIHGVSIAPFGAAAILIVPAVTFGFITLRVLHLRQSIGLTVMGAIASLRVVGIDRLLPAPALSEQRGSGNAAPLNATSSTVRPTRLDAPLHWRSGRRWRAS